MPQENIKTKLEDLVTHSSELGETALKLVSINAYRKTANVSASLLVSISLAFIAGLATMFCSVAMAFWLGDLFHSLALGFLVTGGVYVLLFCILLLLKNKVLLPLFRNRIVKRIYE